MDGQLVFCDHHRLSEPWTFSRLSLVPFTASEYQELLALEPDWTLMETVALLDFAVNNNIDAWNLTVMDKVVCAAMQYAAIPCDTLP